MLTGVKLKKKMKPMAIQLKAVSHPHRLAILYLLSHDQLWLRDIVDHLYLSPSLVAHHLKQMQNAGMVLKSREGRRLVYRLNEKAFSEINKLFLDTPLMRKFKEI